MSRPHFLELVMLRTRTAVIAAAFVLAAVPAATLAAQSATPGFKVGYINSAQILQTAPGRAEADAQIEKELAGFRAQVKRMGDSLNAMVADFRKAEATLSPAAKETRMRSIQQKEEEYQQRTEQLQQQAQQRQLELIRPITDQVQKVIAEMRKEEGYSLIFDVGNGAGVVVAADTTLDITPRVLTRLQAAGRPAAASGATRPAPSGPATQPAGVQRPKPPRE
jgi:outer membrane protein